MCNLVAEDFVEIQCTSSDNRTKFLVDTQAEVSLIKISSLADDAIINKSNIINIFGVTEGIVKSLGTIHTLLLVGYSDVEIETEFIVVPSDFPIPVDGILGKDFIKLHRCSLNYNNFNFVIRFRGETFNVPIIDNRETARCHRISGRCEVIKQFRLNSHSTDDQVVENTEIHPGIFIARCIVNPQKCFLRILNTTNQIVEIDKVLNLQSTNVNEYKILSIQQTTTDRSKSLLKILSKNFPDYSPESLVELCTTYSDIFALP